MSATCPFNENGQHRYFIYRVVDEYEPAAKVDVAVNTRGLDNIQQRQFYERVEYAFMGCNCGSAVKEKVEQR